LRNALWSTWLRRPVPDAMRRSYRLIVAAPSSRLTACLQALAGLPWVARHRRVVPPHVAGMLRLLETAGESR
jgi:hypothetical protein